MEPNTPSHVLIVDDDSLVRRSVSRSLIGAGFRTTECADAVQALSVLDNGDVDAILSDIHMPGMDGLQFLKAVRQRDGEVPVVLITGEPTIETAIQAIEQGATQYLLKPFNPTILEAGLKRAIGLGALARARRRAFEVSTATPISADNPLAAAFDRALDSIWPAFQPIVHWPEGRAYAYEALLRTREMTFRGPQELLDTAEALNRVFDVGRKIRGLIAVAASNLPDDVLLFLNLHPRDLVDPELYDPESPISRIASRCVLEVTERASLEGLGDVTARVRQLRAMGFRIAVDDLGAGYAGLTSLVHLGPDVVKLDMSLVRGIHEDEARQHVVRALVNLSAVLGVKVVAEGIETVEERDSLREMGCGLLQGYWFAPPGPAWPTWRQ